jgi:hypothetical protein
MMGHQSRGWSWRRAPLMLSVAVAVAALAGTTPAEARVGVFFGFGPSIWVPPAYYYPPPFYYPPPPVFYTPPPPVSYTPPPYPEQGAGAATRSCYAGAYVCPLEVRIPAGNICWCPDNRGGRAYGRAG